MSTQATETTTGKWAYPEAELVLRADAPREEWLAARRHGVGGSDASAIAGVNKYSTSYSVWLDKMGEVQEKEETMAMRMGNLLEPVVVKLFEEESGIETRRAGLLRSKQYPWMQVSVDRLTADGGLLECKTSNGWLSHEWEDGQVPDHAELQVQHGLAVTGRSHAWVAGLLDGRIFHWQRVERNEELISMLIEIERRFWHQHVLTAEAPSVTSVDLDTLKDRFSEAKEGEKLTVDAQEAIQLRQTYEEARDMEKVWSEKKDEAAAKIRERVAEFDTLQGSDGVDYLTLKQNGQFSEGKFTKDHPDLAKQYATTVTKVDTKRLKEAEPELYTKYRARVLRTPKLKTD